MFNPHVSLSAGLIVRNQVSQTTLYWDCCYRFY